MNSQHMPIKKSIIIIFTSGESTRGIHHHPSRLSCCNYLFKRALAAGQNEGGWLILVVCFLCVSVGSASFSDNKKWEWLSYCITKTASTVNKYADYIDVGVSAGEHGLRKLGYDTTADVVGSTWSTASGP